MNDEYFIINRDEIEEKKKSLSLINSIENGWELHFVDRISGVNWIEYRVNSEYHGGGNPILVMQPERNASELIELAAMSENLEEIKGACIMLSAREQYHKIEFREELITVLESLYKSWEGKLGRFEAEKLETIIVETNLEDSSNRRETSGKHFSEIDMDFNHYKGIAVRARKIMNEIKKNAATNRVR